MASFDRIEVDPAKVNGRPCIRGTRITVRTVLEALNTFPDRESLRQDYPELDEEDIRQAVAFAAASSDDRIATLPAS